MVMKFRVRHSLHISHCVQVVQNFCAHVFQRHFEDEDELLNSCLFGFENDNTLSSSSSSSLLSPLCRVFTIINLKQTMFLGYIALQLFCIYILCH